MTGGDYQGSIPGLLLAAAQRNPDATWLRSDDGTLTFGGTVTAVGLTAQALASAGVRRGDLVLLTARTTPEYLLSWLAVTAMGAVAVAVNPRSAAAELAGLIGQTTPAAIVTDAHLAPLVTGAAHAARQAGNDSGPLLGVHAMVPEDWASHAAMSAAAGRASLPDLPSPDDLAVLIPTSGTTGRSKLVMQTHRAYAMAGEGFPFWMELTDHDRLMTTLPLFHVNAPAYSVMGSLACGAGLVLVERFSASGFLDAARRHGATEFNAIGAMLEILMRQPERPDDADNPLRLCYTGPAPERQRQLEIENRFGLRIVVGYAMSESPYGLIWPRGTRPYGTLGTVRQHPYLGAVNQARLAGDDGALLGPGQTGELQLRNPVLTPGYWGMPEETAQVKQDGWLRTGDLVTANADGTFTFVARVKEVIRRRGENLSPLEVEEVLESHPSVQDCAVVGVPSELSEEEVKAFLVAAPGQQLDFNGLRSYAAGRLAAFKVPRYWQQIEELPRTPTARVAKHRLPAGHPPQEYDAEPGQPSPHPEDSQ
ncbi:MAG TPA: AMP-binding protein [Streptosporangiaceae bacterium]|nr:AMP-binding protein [Streptosporangiaceae bacterium]